jgi:hypothetical protein
MNPLIQLKKTIPVFLVALACFGLSPMAQALLPPPPPDGGYPGNNTAEGTRALFNLTTGTNNTASGLEALFKNTTGSRNTANGTAALHENIDGISNTATGNNALYNNRTGSQNTATGTGALRSNTTGGSNTANGFQALLSNTTGIDNAANGAFALLSNSTGFNNTAVGANAMLNNTEGLANTAVGWRALQANTTGILNTALGDQALLSNTAGSFHTAIGWGALGSHTCVEVGCDANTAVGESALVNHTTGGGNTAVGESVLVGHITGHQNIALGYVAGQNLTNGNGNIYISNPGVRAEANTIRIGNVVPWTDIYGFPHAAHTATYIAGISGTAVVGEAVVVDGNGQLGTVASAARFKKEIRPMDNTSEAILDLKPVSFQYNSDSKGTPQFGLIAEEVAKVNPDLVIRDRKGEIYSVRYEAVNAMLLNEFLKEHRKNEEQQAIITRLIGTDTRQQKQIEALTAALQKVSAQLELNKLAPQVVKEHRLKMSDS